MEGGGGGGGQGGVVGVGGGGGQGGVVGVGGGGGGTFLFCSADKLSPSITLDWLFFIVTIKTL